MSGRGGGAPPVNGGEFLLQLLRRPPNSHPTPSPPQTFPNDPAVAAMGPSIPTILPSHTFQSNACEFPFNPWSLSSSPPFAPHSYFQQNPNLNPDFSSPPAGFSYAPQQFNPLSIRNSHSDETRNLRLFGDASKPSLAHRQEPNLIFGSVSRDVLQIDTENISHDSLGQRNNFGSSHRGDNLGKDPRLNGLHLDSVRIDEEARGSSNNRGNQGQNDSYRMVAPPPGFASQINVVGNRYGNGRTVDHNVDKGKGNFANLDKNNRSSNPVGSAGSRAGDVLSSVLAFDTESRLELHPGDGENGRELRDGGHNKITEDGVGCELDDLADQLVDSVGLEEESGQSNDQKKHHHDKDYRSDKRGQWIMGQRMRNQKSFTACRTDINRHNVPFLALFESLIPADEEKMKQQQLLQVLEKLVCKEWPEARLYLYGSCANSFGFSKSDVDVCLSMELEDVNKSEVLLKLADIFVSDNLQNVQALTRARVPIVKLMDPVTGISCDICINNVLAVVNTKLLHDYAKIDVRLRQLVFLVKHWAKSRGVNVTYQGTLSSYAYVLMCIHFLQQRRPAILPCLQGMEITYYSTVNNVECAYFDKVDKLCNYGSQNRESIAQLAWAFFHYWAYCHDYANDVISVRTGHTISKRAKDWTRRVGNDRHLICIEDPFEVSHDLGRVVDKFSIRVLREEFERAAHIMQYDPNPCVTLFQPYIPD